MTKWSWHLLYHEHVNIKCSTMQHHSIYSHTETHICIYLLENETCVSPSLLTKSFTIVTPSLSNHLTHMAYFNSTEVVCFARKVILLYKNINEAKQPYLKRKSSNRLCVVDITLVWALLLIWCGLYWGKENLQANTLMLRRLFQVDPIPVTGNPTLGIGSFGTTDCLYWPGRCSNKLKQQICLPSISSVSFMNYCKKRRIECNINESANIMALTWITIQQWELYWYFQCVAVIIFSYDNSYQPIWKISRESDDIIGRCLTLLSILASIITMNYALTPVKKHHGKWRDRDVLSTENICIMRPSDNETHVS